MKQWSMNRNIPAGAVRRPRSRKIGRPLGLAKHKLTIQKSFFKALRDELLNAFEGKK
jgi:hypothetical protein